jgi:uncharacterized protein
MAELHFEWDERKARSNEEKHGISFEEAATAFADEYGLLLDDPDAQTEDRLILLGLSESLRLLVVVHVLRAEEVIRIISARRASRFETREYENRLR